MSFAVILFIKLGESSAFQRVNRKKRKRQKQIQKMTFCCILLIETIKRKKRKGTFQMTAFGHSNKVGPRM